MTILSASDLSSEIRNNLADVLGCEPDAVVVSSIDYTQNEHPGHSPFRIYGEAHAANDPGVVRVFGYFVDELPS